MVLSFLFRKSVVGVAVLVGVCSAMLFFAKPASAQQPPSDPDPLPQVELNEPPIMQIGDMPSSPIMRAETALAVTSAVSPSNRQESFDFFWSQYEMTTTPPISWTGTYTPCNPGTTSAEFKAAVAQRINYFRAMAGAPATITFSDTLSALDQEAALMMSVNNTLNHYPPNTWKCYTTNGYNAAGNSNLSKGTGGLGNGWNAINGYMLDWGAGNTFVGHRRWVLYPQQQVMGTGDIPEGSGYPATNALWTGNFSGSRPPTREEFVAWPPPGYVPFRVVYPRWSFSYPDADFTNATVSMISETVPITVAQYAVYPAFGSGSYVGDNTLSWVPAGYNYDGSGSWVTPPANQDMTITVSISNVIVSGVARSFNYTVVVFNDDIIAPTGAITIANGYDYTMSPSVLTSLSASDYRGVKQMRFYTGTTPTAWMTYSSAKTFDLGMAEGTKFISVQYRDQAGNTSDWYTDTIILDMTPPTGTILANNGAYYAPFNTTVSLSATDNYSLSQMELYWPGKVYYWEPFVSPRAVTFTYEGPTTVQVTLRDAAGNVSGISSDTVVVDGTPPATTGITIAGGAAYTNTPVVPLSLNATDTYSMASMNIAINGAWQGWMAYAPSKVITLTGGPTLLMAPAAMPNRPARVLAPLADGNQTVNAQFRDAAGNLSVIVTDTIFLDTTPPTGTVSINLDALYTNSPTTTLALTATDNVSVANMRLNINGIVGAWQTFATSAQAVLTGADGLKSVSAQYRDAVGNASEWVTDTIILDTTPPTGSVSINNVQVYTNALPAQLTLTATDNLSLTQMNVYAEGVWLGWVSYAPSQSITLSSGDGVKVYGAQYKDAAGNISAFYTDTIILDTTPPTASLSLNYGAVYAQSSPVTASLTAADNYSLTQMQYQVDGALQSWEPIAGAKQVALAGDGAHTVTVRAQDGAGNVSAYYTDTIILDTTPPTGTISINNGAAYATTTTLTLALSATDAYTVAQMRLYYNGFWHSLTPYATSATIVITDGNTYPTVNVQFVDEAGNGSASAYDAITIDMTPPTGSITLNGGAAYTNLSPVTAVITAADNVSLDAMQLGYDGVLQGWEAINTTKQIAFAGDGVHTATLQIRDGAGNISAWYTDTIILDTTPPNGTILVNNGATYANTTTLTLTLSATDNYTVTQMRFYYDGFWHALQPYSTSATIVVTSGNTSPAINVQFVDGAGNGNASAIFDGILIDMNPPTGSILLSGGAVYATATPVFAGIGAADDISLDAMQLAYDGVWQAWEPVAGSKNIPFAGDGVHTATLRLRDGAGNISVLYTDTIILDTTPPTGTVSINNGAAYMNQLTSTVYFSATDNISLTQMNLYVDGVWLGWEPYVPTKTVVFTGGDGVKYINVNYRDAAGNQLAIAVFDSIIYETTPPQSLVNALPGMSNAPVAVSWQWYGSEVSGVKCYDVQTRAGLAGAWTLWQTCAATTTAPFSGDIGITYYFRSSAMDNAGNVEAYPISPDYDAFTCVDVNESNNTAAQAGAFTPGITQTQAFCQTGDVDWLKFTAQGGAKYSFATTGVTTTIDLIAADGVMVLASGTNAIASRTFSAGVYYLRVRNTSLLVGRYDVSASVTPPRMVYVPNTVRAYSSGW